MANSRSKGRKAKWWLAAVLAAVCSSIGGCRERPAPSAISAPGEEDTSARALFRDTTPQSGVQFTYHNGQEADHYAILESLGGGVALIDYDGDGLLDIFVTGGGYYDGPKKQQIKGHPCRLYKNLGNWKFRDVTSEVGLDKLQGGQPWFYTHGAAVADYDNDGWPDLLVTGYGRVALFHNEASPGSGRRFVDVTQKAGLGCERSWSTSAAWADLDGDGYADLYVCHYVDWSVQNNPPCEGYSPEVARDVCPPKQFDAYRMLIPQQPRRHVYRRQQGSGPACAPHLPGLRATHVPEPAGQGFSACAAKERDYGKGLGVIIVDVNGDGRPDIYVTNDTTEKFLYINRSAPRFGLKRWDSCWGSRWMTGASPTAAWEWTPPITMAAAGHRCWSRISRTSAWPLSEPAEK